MDSSRSPFPIAIVLSSIQGVGLRESFSSVLAGLHKGNFRPPVLVVVGSD